MACVEQGLLLYRVRCELGLTMEYYRRAYESAVAYEASKRLELELSLEESRRLNLELETKLQEGQAKCEQKHSKGENENDDTNLEARICHFKQGELLQKDQVIKRQRRIIEALAQKSVNQIRNPADI